MIPDFDDPLDDLFAGAKYVPVKPAKPAVITLDWSEAEAEDVGSPQTFRENCKKCGGSGRFRVAHFYHFPSVNDRGPCYACKGVGYFERKTSPEARAKAKAATVARKARVETDTLAAFAIAEPAISAWIEATRARFEFAQSMHDAIVKYGTLTERQRAACERLAAKDAERAVERVQRAANAPEIATDRLMAAFDSAKAAGLKFPKMRFDGFQASLAPVTGKNAGAVYLKSGETYLGKIAAGRFHASRDCDDAKRAAIVATMADPLAAAVAYGKRTGTCSCCGAELTNALSIELGIGPICRTKFGF